MRATRRLPPAARRASWLATALVAAGASIGASASATADSDSGVPRSTAIVRYESPSRATRLPASFRRRLLHAGCRIPQPAFKASNWQSGIENVVTGHFARRRQRDWAAVCSRHGVSRVVFHWGGPHRCPALPDRWPDASTAGLTEDGDLGFLVAIDPISREGIAEFESSGDEYRAPLRAHGGLSIVRLTKGMSDTRYCDRGRWLVLPGMD